MYNVVLGTKFTILGWPQWPFCFVIEQLQKNKKVILLCHEEFLFWWVLTRFICLWKMALKNGVHITYGWALHIGKYVT